MAEYDPDQLRNVLKRYIEKQKASGRKFTPAGWCDKAGVSTNALAHFLNGKSNSLRGDTLTKLAAAEGKTVAELIGGPASEAPRRSRAAIKFDLDQLDHLSIRAIREWLCDDSGEAFALLKGLDVAADGLRRELTDRSV